MEKTLAHLRNGEQVTIVALGDSVTETTFHTQGRMNWVELLREAIFERYGAGVCTMVNTGRCGATWRSAASQLERDVLRFRPNLVIVALGMNDACDGRMGLPRFRCQVREVVVAIHKKCDAEILIRTPNPVVTVHGLPLPAEQLHPGRPYECEDRPVKEYAEALVELAAELGCAVVDHYSAWIKREFTVPHPVANPTGLWPRMGDAIHPGWLGHLAFYRELAPLFDTARHFPWEEVDN